MEGQKKMAEAATIRSMGSSI